jgi:hypothetical protein
MMAGLADYMTRREINLDNILLDPNNPRFSELGEPADVVPESRFAEPHVQRNAFEKMKRENFDVSELRDTIKTLGFLQMDRVVVRPWRGNSAVADKYVVVEGNRRIAALKWLIELNQAGRETFSAEQLSNYTLLEVLVLDDLNAPDSARWILPGLRHVSGIKEWGAYQKARAVNELRETGSSPQQAAQSLGLSTRAANQLWRSFLALENMQSDEEYSEFAEPKLYSFFEEVFKRPAVKNWLQWDDNEKKFVDQGRLSEFYGWMVGDPSSDEGRGEPKLPEAKSVRDLGEFINDEAALSVFRSANGSLARAMARYQTEHPGDWKPTIVQAQNLLRSLSPDSLRALTADDLLTLENLKSRIELVLSDRQRLMEHGNV